MPWSNQSMTVENRGLTAVQRDTERKRYMLIDAQYTLASPRLRGLPSACRQLNGLIRYR